MCIILPTNEKFRFTYRSAMFPSLACLREYFYNEPSHAYIKFEYISSYCIKSIDNTYFVMSLIASNNSMLCISDKLSWAARHFKRR